MKLQQLMATSEDNKHNALTKLIAKVLDQFCFWHFYRCFVVLHAVSSCFIKSDILEKVLAQVLQLYFLISECVCR